MIHLRGTLQKLFGWDQGGESVRPEAVADKQLLVKAMVTHAVTNIMVERSAPVAPQASEPVRGITWEVCEQRGYVTLVSEGEGLGAIGCTHNAACY